VRLSPPTSWLRRWRSARSDAARAQFKKQKWERYWQVESERPVEQLATTVPKELKDAVAEGWIAPGSSVMDIGSGRGQISAWLAERGFAVLGVDIAEAATELARRHFADVGPHLEFRTLNICLDQPEPDRFDAFVDRGCFQGARELRRRYLENVLTWSRPGAKLLLFHKVDERDLGQGDLPVLRERLERRMRDLFEPAFAIERSGPTAEPLMRSAGPIPRKVMPGMVFWMTRR
jgi:cyclopropane fatty-acyl-phospholipid synthase-like methyltransferase